jgi:ABC-2 type transport system ATP-binding protein
LQLARGTWENAALFCMPGGDGRMIEVTNLTKRFGDITAVDDVTFSVEKGEIVGLLGPNGAGKTTTMRILAGFLSANEGRATVAGFDVAKQSLPARRRIGYMPESTPLYQSMTVRRHLQFMAAIRGVAARDRRRRVGQAMEASGTTHVADRLIRHLSKGYRQRVGLAQAMVADPEILILDEPTIGLDPTQIIEIRRLIRAMAERRTVILSSHILPEVSEVCQRVIIINRGRVIASESTAELARQLQTGQRVIVEVRGARGEVEKILRGHPQVTEVALEERVSADGAHRFLVESGAEGDLRPDLARALVAAGHDLLRLEERTLTLEEIFLQLVADESRGEGP